jgi:hypothetical protein
MTLAFTAGASGWSKPSDFAISSPSGGIFQVCRDGIRFQVATRKIAQGERPTEPYTFQPFTIYSPPAVPDPEVGNFVGGRIILQGAVTLKLRARPFNASNPGDGEDLYWYLGTHTQAWPGGQRLAPAPHTLLLNAGGDPFSIDQPYAVENCLLFGHRKACARIRARLGPTKFRARYGTGPHKRKAMQNCVKAKKASH